MTSLRESPIRRQKPGRPTWLVALLVVVAVLVVVGIGYGIVSLVRGSSESSSVDSATPTSSPCVTTVVTAADVLPKPAKVKVNVFNATATSGLASKTASELENRGFTVGKVANDPVGKPIPGVAEIRFGAKGAQGAQLLLLYVPGAELVQLDRKGRQVDLATGTGFTGLAPQPEVAAQLASPSPVASGPGCPTPAVADGAAASPSATP
jgi:hypothetical protein